MRDKDTADLAIYAPALEEAPTQIAPHPHRRGWIFFDSYKISTMPFSDQLRYEKEMTPVFIPRPIANTNAVSYPKDATPRPIQGIRAGRQTPFPQWVNAGNGKAPINSPQYRLCQKFGI